MHEVAMKCRAGCGACCIAPSITGPIPGMPGGKPAGITCRHLTPDHLCALFSAPSRPRVCKDFKASIEMCGSCREHALAYLAKLEEETAPAISPAPLSVG